MHFNFSPWDFFSKQPKFLYKEELGLYGLYCQDPYFSRLAHLKLKSALQDKIKVVLGSEVTADWIEDQFINTGLFASSEPILVLMAETIPGPSQELFLQYQIDLKDRLVLFSFTGKSGFFDKLKKNKEGIYYKIDAVAPWQYDRVLNLFCDEMKISLSRDLKSMILDSVSADTGEIVNLLKNIRINYPRGIKTAEELKPFLQNSHFDQFELADIIADKKMRDFYFRLSKIDSSQGEWIKLFSFIQNHLFKISDPTYIKDKKGQPSQYDKRILNASKKWNRDEIKRELKKLSKFLMIAKASPEELKSELTLAYTRTFTI